MPDDPNQQLPLDNVVPGGNIQPVNIEDEMRRSYLDYSMSVIIGRALPRIRDGLKPVHRRILYAMHDMGVLHNRKHMKCAGVVGECLKKYHPHGDSAVYDAMVRPGAALEPALSVDRWPRATLVRSMAIRPQLTGTPKSRLTEIAERCWPISTRTPSTSSPIPTTPRSSRLCSLREFPICWSMARTALPSAWRPLPPHNLTEIVDGAITLVNNPHATLADILKFVQGPDFPTGGFIHGRSGIMEAYRTGRGRFLMRAKAAIEHVTKDKEAIIVTEIPYQVNKANMIKHIAELVNNKVIDEISDVRDESDRDGIASSSS